MRIQIDQALFYDRPGSDNTEIRLILESPTPKGHEAMCRLSGDEQQHVRWLLANTFQQICRMIVNSSQRPKD